MAGEAGTAPGGHHRFTVTEDLAGSRVDAGLARLMDISRSQAAVLIAEGNVTSNAGKVGNPSNSPWAPCSRSWYRTAGTPWKSWRK